MRGDTTPGVLDEGTVGPVRLEEHLDHGPPSGGHNPAPRAVLAPASARRTPDMAHRACGGKKFR